MNAAWKPGPSPELDAAIRLVGARRIAAELRVTQQRIWQWHLAGEVPSTHSEAFRRAIEAAEGVWPEIMAALLRRLWTETTQDGRPAHTAAAIAKRMGISMSSVRNRARRMGLPARTVAVVEPSLVPPSRWMVGLAPERCMAGFEVLPPHHPISFAAIDPAVHARRFG